MRVCLPLVALCPLLPGMARADINVALNKAVTYIFAGEHPMEYWHRLVEFRLVSR